MYAILESIHSKIKLYASATGNLPRAIYMGRVELDDFLIACHKETGLSHSRQGLEYQGIYVIEVLQETHLGVGG